MRVDAAGLRAGTGVASISTADSLVMNATINSLLGGGNIGLTAAHYDALASADANAGAVLDALALDLGLTGGTYGELLESQVSVDQLLDAAIRPPPAPGLGVDPTTPLPRLPPPPGQVP